MSAGDVIAKFIRPYTLNDKELPALVAKFYSTLATFECIGFKPLLRRTHQNR